MAMIQKHALICHQSYADGSGTLARVSFNGEKHQVTPVKVNQNRLDKVFYLNYFDEQVVIFDTAKQCLSLEKALPKMAFPAYHYYDRKLQHVWMVNDGDEENGIDPFCDNGGASATVIDNSHRHQPRLLKTICMGRGHHVISFIDFHDQLGNAKRRAFASNLQDGTISVIDNQPESAQYLHIIQTINLLEKDHEKDPKTSIPNNAFPHGMVYSPVTRKLYNLNNGYGTIAVIDPLSMDIENRIPMKFSSNLLLSPDGKYLIGKGADRKSDAAHVIGYLSVVDVVTAKMLVMSKLVDFYPSTYRFSSDGKKLYVTSASTGHDVQKARLKTNVIYVYDATALPQLHLIQEITVGHAHCSRRPLAYVDEGTPTFTYFPNPTEGTLSIVNCADQVVETVKIGAENAEEVTFSYWEGKFGGC